MIVDLILLVLITSMFFLFLGTQTTAQSAETGASRSRNTFTQKLLLTTMGYKTETAEFGNLTIAELLENYHCGYFGAYIGNYDFLDAEINALLNKTNKQDYYFIFKSESDLLNGYDVAYSCSPDIKSGYNCCIRTEKVSIAVLNLKLYCEANSSATISIGIWPKSMGVESC